MEGREPVAYVNAPLAKNCGKGSASGSSVSLAGATPCCMVGDWVGAKLDHTQGGARGEWR
jgi:hypothetical protein